MTESEELSIEMSDEVADQLLKVRKIQIDDKEYGLGLNSFACRLQSLDGREQFSLDYGRSGITLKYKLQCRARTYVPLVRLEVNGGWHKNPRFAGPGSPDPYSEREFKPGESHIHVYRHGYGDRWAYPVPENTFTDLNDRMLTLKQFEDLCNIDHIKVIEEIKDQQHYIEKRERR